MPVTENNFVAARPGTALGQPASLFKVAQFFRTTFTASPGPGNIVDIPGPPSSEVVRCYDAINVLSATVGAPLAATTVLTLNPGAFQLTTLGASTASGSIRVPALFFGESLRITNGAANPGIVMGTYVDIPSTYLTNVRIAVTNVLATVIPAAPTGSVSRLLQAGEITNAAGRTMCAKIMAFNADSVAHAMEFHLGGVITRHTATGPGAQFPIREPAWQVPVTTVPLQVVVAEATVTTPSRLFTAYETIPL